jgi:hypothetical protein
MTITVTEAGRCFTSPAAYTDEDRLHEALSLLRRQAPVHRVEAPVLGRHPAHGWNPSSSRAGRSGWPRPSSAA